MATEVRDETLANLSGTTAFADLAGCDLVIEAIVENLDAKKDAYHKLEAFVGPETIFASNTSSLCITELAAATLRPDRFVGLHFFNPVPLMKLVEVVRALTTSDDTHARTFAFATVAGEGTDHRAGPAGLHRQPPARPLPARRDPRATRAASASVEDIDNGMKLGCGYPMGPFTLLDFVGLDTTYYIANIMFDEFREPMYAPPPLLKRMVVAGWLGRKSGRGFYNYQ